MTDNAVQFAVENLNETEENRKICLDELREWLQKDGIWLNARLEDKYLLPFLRGCKFNLIKTKVKITNYYIMRRDRPEWFKNRNPLLTILEELIKLGVFIPLKQHYQNKAVIIIRTASHDPKKYSWDDFCKIGKMILDILCQEDEFAQIYGIIAIFDMTGIGFNHYKTMTPNLIKKIVFAWQNYHLRPKQLEFINSPTYINIVLNIFKSFMSAKMKSRVQAHYGGVEKAQIIVSKEILPLEYGGTTDSMESLGNFWFKKLVENKEWFQEDEKFKAQ